MTPIEEKISYQFKNKALLEAALMHPSYSHEKNMRKDNQRLEFLGDSVLDLIVSDELFLDESLDEGQLTRMRAKLVCERSLYTLAEALTLGEDLLLGHTFNDAHLPRSILSDAVESLIGAIYLDSDYETTRSIVLKHFWDVLYLSLDNEDMVDSKTKLQEYIQKHTNSVIEYKTIEVSGPAHEREFTIGLYIDGVMVGTGQGSSKKRAEKQAAQEYLNDEIR